MRPIPIELADLRHQTAASYQMRKEGWRADPRLIAALVEAERAFTGTFGESVEILPEEAGPSLF